MEEPDDSPRTQDKAAKSIEATGAPKAGKGMSRLVLDLIRPYRWWLIVVFVAMLIETAMSIAAPWPLKIIIDNVVGDHKRVYHHLQRLSLKYCDTHQIGNMLSTITSDVGTIQNFASTALLSILVDSLDLTDEGLFTDLEEHGGGAERLVLRMDDDHAKKHKK